MTAWIGPVQLVDLFEPQITWTGTPTAQGLKSGVITAQTEWWQTHQLDELVNNPHRRVTIAGVSGVLEPVYFTDPLLGPTSAWALLQSFQLGQADQTHSLQGTTGLVPYTLNLTSVGDGTQRQVVVVRSARAKPNDFGLPGSALVANPLWQEDPTGGDFISSPGGSRFTREYDAAFPHSTPRLTSTDARQVTLYTAPLVGGKDRLALVALPPLAQSYNGPPSWVSHRGGDCRIYDRRQMREVYGPSHPLAMTTDLMVTNGLFRFWLGNKGLAAFLNVQAFANGSWREVGTVPVSTAKLIGARIVKVTPDVVTVTLVLQGKGEAFATLKRGDRMVRLSAPAGAISPLWRGIPPTSRTNGVLNFTGHFGTGLDGGGDAPLGTWSAPFATWGGDPRYTWDGRRNVPDIRFLWPPELPATAWGKVFWLRSDVAASALSDGAGFFTIYDANGARVADLYLDPADTKIKFRIGATVLASAAQTYGAGTDICIGVRFSTVNGMALSVRAPNGTVTHFANTSATTPGTTTSHYDFAYIQNDVSWGDGAWGDGVWGGLTRFPGGVIDNAMIFDGWFTNAEFEALAAAVNALDGLPQPEARLIWYGPFDAEALPNLSNEVNGFRIDPNVDANGLQKALVYLDSQHRSVGVALARGAAFDRPSDHQAQFAAESEQTVRVR